MQYGWRGGVDAEWKDQGRQHDGKSTGDAQQTGTNVITDIQQHTVL